MHVNTHDHDGGPHGGDPHGGERVDLRLPLDRLPLAVRLAGLDRDPGWIPAAGADFRFHFH